MDLWWKQQYFARLCVKRYHIPMKNHSSYLPSKKAAQRKLAVKSFKAKANARRTVPERIADFVTSVSGTITFLVLNLLAFVFWIIWNLGVIPGLTPFDPFPFGFLTMIVSLEAIVLAIIVLVSQNREAHIAELRDEVELYINTYSETEITKIMYLLTLLLKKHGIDISKDAELQEMLNNLEADKIEKQLEQQL